jgi:hypothetical protein
MPIQRPRSILDTGQRRHLAAAVEIELARRDPNAFCEYAMRDPEGRPWRQAQCHREWQALLPRRGPARVLIGAPRESAKTTQMAIGRVIWELGTNPSLRVKIITSTDDLAGDIVSAIGEHILRNPRVRHAFPHLQPASPSLWPKPGARASRLVVARHSQDKDPSVSGHSVLSTGAGGRADLLVFDDVVDYRNAVASPSLRGRVAQSLLEVWINQLGPTGRAVYVGTVWHEEDLTMQLKDNPAWTVWWRPARDEVTGEALWPERWDAEALAAREREIGARAFARQYLLQPLSEEERSFPEEVLAACRDVTAVPGRIEVPDSWPRYCGVDLAASLGQKASWTVMVTVAVDPGSKRRHPLEIIRKRQHFPATIRMIRQQWEQWKPRLICVESNAFQQAVVQELARADCSIPVRAHATGSEKMDPQIGIPSLSAGMANGSWLIPAGGTPHPGRCECGWCAWVRELTLHPGGEYTDCVMAMWLCELAAREGLRGYMSPESLRNWIRANEELRRPNPWTELGGVPRGSRRSRFGV